MWVRLYVLAFFCLHGSLVWGETMRVHFIDVGQGSAALVEFPCGTMLIDTGGEATNWKVGKIGHVYGGSNAAIGYLQGYFNARRESEPRLDLLVLSHPHIDHTRGVPQIVQQFRPRNIVYSAEEDQGSGLAEQMVARRLAESSPDVSGWFVLERKIADGAGLTNSTIDPFGKCDTVDPEIRVLWGTPEEDAEWHRSEYKDRNNHSIVVRIDFGEASILFTGDLEESEKSAKAGIERLLEKYEGTDLLDADVYHVGHHGSANGNTLDLTEAISPEIAVLSHGPECAVRKGFSAWGHGHPRKETIDELLGCKLPNDESCLRERPSKGVQIFNKKKKVWETVIMTKAIYTTGWDGTIVLEATAGGDWSIASLTGPDECLSGV